MKRLSEPSGLLESPEHHGGSYKKFYELKTAKVQQQYAFEREAMGSANASVDPKSLFFDGVVAYVNGWTRPAPDELRRLIVSHGGRCETWEHGGMTHILCESVPDTKAKHLLKQRPDRGKRWVRPEWVVDCVAAGKRLSEKLYPPGGLEAFGQTGVSSYFGAATKPAPAPKPAPKPAPAPALAPKTASKPAPAVALASKNAPSPAPTPTSAAAPALEPVQRPSELSMSASALAPPPPTAKHYSEGSEPQPNSRCKSACSLISAHACFYYYSGGV